MVGGVGGGGDRAVLLLTPLCVSVALDCFFLVLSCLVGDWVERWESISKGKKKKCFCGVRFSSWVAFQAFPLSECGAFNLIYPIYVIHFPL